MKNIPIVSDTRHSFITLNTRYADQGSWIVQKWKELMWFKKSILTDWFNDERRALAFAHTGKRIHHGKEILRYEEE